MLKLDNIAPLPVEKREWLRAFGEPTDAPAFIANAPPRPPREPDRFPRAERIAEARAMIQDGADNVAVMAKCGLSLAQVAGVRARVEQRY